MAIIGVLQATNHSKYVRPEADFYATDPKCVDDLLGVEDISHSVLEPACGAGHISKRLIERGRHVVSFDLHDRGYGMVGVDFLSKCWHWKGDIVTNPPYNLAEQFVRHALGSVEDGDKVAMFLRIQFLESVKRKLLFESQPPKRVYVYSARQKVGRNGDFVYFNQSSVICFAWFVWEKGFQGDTILKWL